MRQLTSSRPAQQICHAHHGQQLILRELCGGSLQDIRDRLCLRKNRRKIRSSILNLSIAALIAIPLIGILPGIFQILDCLGVILRVDSFYLVLPSKSAIHIGILQVSWVVRNKRHLTLTHYFVGHMLLPLRGFCSMMP